VFWKRATGPADTAQPTITDPGNHIGARIFRIEGCVTTGNPWDKILADSEVTIDTSGSFAGDTTTVADCLIFVAHTSAIDTATAQFSSQAITNCTNIAEHADDGTISGNGGVLGVFTGDKATAGAFGPATVTYATASEKSWVIMALKPPAGAGTEHFSDPLSVSGAASITVAAPTRTTFAGALAVAGTGAITVASPLRTRLSGALSVAAASGITVAAPLRERLAGPIAVSASGLITVAAPLRTRLAGPVAVSGSGAITVADPVRETFSGVIAVSATGAIVVQNSVIEGVVTEHFVDPLSMSATAAITVDDAIRETFSGALSLSATAAATIADSIRETFASAAIGAVGTITVDGTVAEYFVGPLSVSGTASITVAGADVVVANPVQVIIWF
jgi:hypothetical protein